MSAILEQLRSASPEEQQECLAFLVKKTIASDDRRPITVTDGPAATIAYLTPTLGGERVFPEITPEVIATVEERMRNPGPCMSAEEFIQRVERMVDEKLEAARGHGRQ